MKRMSIILFVVTAFVLAACGMNPAEKLQEAASEKVAETLVEQATGLENLDVNTEDGSVTYSVDDGEGGTMEVAVAQDTDMSNIDGMGFTIPLPAGLVNGAKQVTDKNGEPMMIGLTAELDGLTIAQLVDDLHGTLTAQGFVYNGAAGETAPDTSVANFMPFIAYTHPDGYQFSIIGDDSGLILSLIKVDDGSGQNDTGQNGETAVTLPTTLDGSMNVDKTSFGTQEAVVITLVLNEPQAEDAWVGIVPSDTPHGLEADGDAADLTYEYVSNAVDGKITLYAPSEPGSYDVRMYSTDSASANGVELASVTIVVK
ncbi:MAG: hypothetical protein IAF02_22765 [Anaerolineae bacterium]|nr:hypothetical protein [Anaerolineae bacterium]